MTIELNFFEFVFVNSILIIVPFGRDFLFSLMIPVFSPALTKVISFLLFAK